MKSKSINVGDMFLKQGDPKTVWVVEQLVDLPGLPLHAELKAQGYLKRMTMMSLAALADQNLYRRIEEGSP